MKIFCATISSIKGFAAALLEKRCVHDKVSIMMYSRKQGQNP